ncbi:DNA repair protein RecO [Cohnella cholangitidis]|uniref:DNA repair protein RecO n=1 Tax=Cohnella cholangitidis TaxID=2598458 RepID=A0A7G5BTY9_9BACL|nr:DNA repair protein RecO [Cohnella cholangitidis]QMV40423.1 DNA repair protein RecO [Cohnella cholangitidis]
MLYRVEGLVIRSTDYGEGNKIVTLLTPSYGKQGIIVRGAKKLKSRYGALAQLFTYGDYSYYKSGTLGTLNSGEILESFQELREGLEGPAYAAYAAELTDRAINDDEAAAYLFHQLKACQSALAGGKDPQVVLRAYEMKIIAAAGYAPMLDECVSCGNDGGPFRFSSVGGGALCSRCWHRDTAALELEDAVWKLLRVFLALDLRRLGNIAVKPSTKRQLQLALRRWMDTHLNLNLKSRGFLDQWEKYGDLLGEQRRRPEPPPQNGDAGDGTV